MMYCESRPLQLFHQIKINERSARYSGIRDTVLTTEGEGIGRIMDILSNGAETCSYWESRIQPTRYVPVPAAISSLRSLDSSVRTTATLFPLRRILPEAVK